MYLVPWQIFVFGCICGVVITAIIILAIVVRFALHSGVRVEKHIIEKEEDDNE